MPWASKRQQGWGHSPAGVKALGGAAKVKEWDTATDFKKLPEKAPRALVNRFKPPKNKGLPP